MSADVLNAWIEGRTDSPAHSQHPSTASSQTQPQQSLKLFSLNDYLGLSTHPAVCRAASEAALAYGMGTFS